MKSADLREGRMMGKETANFVQNRNPTGDSAVARTVFAGARMVSTNMSAVRAVSADFSDADLSNVDIKGADLRSANLEGANLGGGNLSPLGTD